MHCGGSFGRSVLSCCVLQVVTNESRSTITVEEILSLEIAVNKPELLYLNHKIGS